MIFNRLKHLNRLLSLIYPNYCRQCEQFIKSDLGLCDLCYKKIRLIASTTLAVTPKYPLKIFAASNYQQPLKNFVMKKFFDEPLASRQLGKIIVDLTPIENFDFDLIVPIPLHWSRYAKRGFNQSHVMAKEIGKSLGVPVFHLLSRSKRTKFQSSLSGMAKEENVKGVFKIKNRKKKMAKNLLKDKRILLVDDLCTSGATLKNAARTLVDFKPNSLMAVVACRAC